MSDVLLLARDPARLAGLQRLVALAGATPVVAADAEALRRHWRSAAAAIAELELSGLLDRAPLGRRLPLAVVDDEMPASGAGWRVAAELGARLFAFPASERDLLDWLVLGLDATAGNALVVGIVAGSGGAGASTLAAALAVHAAGGGASTLLDTDPAAGGVDLLLGAEQAAGPRWPELAAVEGAVASAALAETLPRAAGVSFVSCDRSDGLAPPAAAVQSVVRAARRGGGRVVVDLARYAAASEAALPECDVVALVAAATVRGAAAASGVLRWLAAFSVPCRLVVRTFPRARLRPPDVAAYLGLPPGLVMRTDPAVAAAADAGVVAARGAVARTARLLLEQLNATPPAT